MANGDKSALFGGSWALFIQPNGPNTAPEYLGCHDLGDVSKSLGDKTLIYCPSPNGVNTWDIVGSFRGEPGPTEFTIETQIQKAADILEDLNCPVPIYALNMCGRRDEFGRWVDRGFQFINAEATNLGLTNIAKRNPGDNGESMQSYDMSANDFYRVYDITLGTQGIGEVTDLKSITSCDSDECEGVCGPRTTKCTTLYVAAEAPSGSPSEVAHIWTTTNEGQTWSVLATAPFADAEDIAAIRCFSVDRDTTRIIAARGTTDAGNPAEIAYSDDNGATWTNVNVGSTNGQYALTHYSLFVLSSVDIWLVTTGGGIYKSEDAGVSWTAQTSGTASNLYAIHGIDDRNLYVGGLADLILRTTDGGTSWTTKTATGGGNNIVSLAVLSPDSVWVGDDGGQLWYTTNAATSWSERAFNGSGSGAIRAIEFYDDLNGYFTHDTTAPVGTIFRTINGGYLWEAQTTPTNAGLNSLFVCDPNLVYGVGNVSAGSSIILRGDN